MPSPASLPTLIALLLSLVASAQPAAAQFAEVVQVRVQPSLDRVTPADQLVLAVVLDHDEHYHTWPAAAQDVLPPSVASFAIRTAISVDTPSPAIKAIGPIQWPEPTPALVPNVTTGMGTIEILAYQGKAVAYVPILIADDARPGSVELNLALTYQACNDTQCLIPTDVARTVSLEVVADQTERGEPLEPELFDGFDPSVFAAMAAGEATRPPVKGGAADGNGDDGNLASEVAPSSSARPMFLGLVQVPTPDSLASLIIISLLGILGGLVLNLTPCVLPVIPIKVMTISQHAGSRGRTLVLGMSMALGVVAFWIAAGLPVILFTKFSDPSQIFGIWWVTAGIGLLIGAMAFGLMGMFQITLPQGVYALNPKADTIGGSFVFGIMTAILGLPCFGFVAGALLPAAAAAPDGVVMAIFASLGVGMALPYFMLSLFPGLVKRIPRAGPASELVKQVMGLLLLAAAAYFIGSGLIGLVNEKPWMGKQLHWWAVALFATLAGVWLVFRTFQITSSPARRAGFSLLALVIGGAAILYAWDSTRAARLASSEQTWVEYSPERFERARTEGKVVVLDFTAEWCLNCKFLKATVLNRRPVKPALGEEDVVAMTVDLTSTSAPGWEFLRELGQTGIPLLAIYRPDDPRPWQSNAYTPEQVMDAIDWARQGREVALRPSGEAPGR